MWYEYIVVTLTAALAGIGTGLVGLSAATAMVPLMIVLCPTFGGEHGAYMATAIALARDILGSAVTTGVYAKKNRLKHGWLIAACIIGMCTVGSIAVYFTHQSVLGGFSLFLCVAIGIRFLVKLDSKERPEKEDKVKLTFKEIAVSLFFGLTIGFGTGFFGSGGGDTYLRSDGVKHIGPHTIFFTFRFDGKDYRFARNTALSEEIHHCSEGYELTGVVWSKREFTDWLKERYAIDFPGLSFRETLSSFSEFTEKRTLMSVARPKDCPAAVCRSLSRCLSSRSTVTVMSKHTTTG